METMSPHNGNASVATEVRPDILSLAEEAQVVAYADLVANLREMVNEPTYSDVTFVCSDGKQVAASRMLLAGRCTVLKSMLMNGMAESSLSRIQLPEISSSVLLSVFEFIYTGTLLDYSPQSWRMGCELIIASRFFLLPNLETITRKYIHDQICVSAADLPKAAYLLTEAVEYKALCDKTDFTLRELVTILSSNWSDSDYILSLSEDAFHYLLANSNGIWEDDDKLTFKEYLRFRQVIRWWVFQHYAGSKSAEGLLEFIAPDEANALSLCRNSFNLAIIGRPSGDGKGHSADWESLQLDEVLRKSAIRLMTNIDCRWIHPILLKEVLEPLKVISSEELLNAFRFHAIRRRIIFKALEPNWEHGASHRTSEQGFFVHKASSGTGIAVMTVPMFRLYVVYEWRFLVEEMPLSFCELGFLYCSNGLGAEKSTFDGMRLSSLYRARALDFLEEGARINWEGEGGRLEWKTIGNKLHMGSRAVFRFNASKRTCSLILDGQHLGEVWKDLPSAVYYPAVSLGISSHGRVRIALISGFDVV